MIKAKVIGLGAAGNKAAIALIEKGVMRKEDVLLINSTFKDIPDKYCESAYLLEGADGCGKERTIAKRLATEFIKKNENIITSFPDPDTRSIIIVSSTEGGTGSGSAVIFAKYIREHLNMYVHMYAFTGFEDDGRGLQNTIEYFQELSANYAIQAISNKAFQGPRLQAETKANDEFVKKVIAELGLNLEKSDQNIDDTDLAKTTNTPGYTVIAESKLDHIKNMDDFNATIDKMLDYNPVLSFEPTAKRMAVMLNINKKTASFIDDGMSVLKARLGSAYELYRHTQFTESSDDEWIIVIASGLKMPLEEIKAVYQKYKERSDQVDKSQDDFFNFVGNLRGNAEDSMFDIGLSQINNPKKGDSDWLASDAGNKKSKFTNTSTKNKNDLEGY